MKVGTAPKQTGSVLYGSGCVQLAAAIRHQLGLRDGSDVRVWVRVYDSEQREVGDATLDAVLTSGGELYIGKKVPGARRGHQVDLIVLRP